MVRSSDSSVFVSVPSNSKSPLTPTRRGAEMSLTKRSLPELEAVIERGLTTFVEVGTALKEIRDRRLYRDSHNTFDTYCRERWRLSRAHAYRLIEAAEIGSQLSPMGDTPPPTNERQVRDLARIPDREQRDTVWRAAHAEYGPAVTAAQVRELAPRVIRPVVRVTTETTRVALVRLPNRDPDPVTGSDGLTVAERDRIDYAVVEDALKGVVAAIERLTSHDPDRIVAAVPKGFVAEHLEPAIGDLVRWSPRVAASVREVPLVLGPGKGEDNIAVREVEEPQNN